MQYLCLIYENEANRAARSPEEMKQSLADYGTFTASIKQSGHFVGGEALVPVASATTVRVRDGETLLTDGPFAETKEQLGGYYLIEAKDLDDALSVAKRIPTAKTGSVEVRPLMVWEQ
jgi:hypothetical protein